MMDQLLMGLALLNKKKYNNKDVAVVSNKEVSTSPSTSSTSSSIHQTIQLVCDYNQDYHVSAMIKVLRLLRHQVNDKREGGQRRISIILNPQ